MVIVYGEPKGKARPRFTRSGFVYTPKETKDYEKLIQSEYIKQKGECFKDKPVFVGIYAYYQIPKSFSKKKREQIIDGDIVPQVKPDIDNVAKIVLDALNKIAYDDDKNIVTLFLSKRYSTLPRIEIKIRENG